MPVTRRTTIAPTDAAKVVEQPVVEQPVVEQPVVEQPIVDAAKTSEMTHAQTEAETEAATRDANAAKTIASAFAGTVQPHAHNVVDIAKALIGHLGRAVDDEGAKKMLDEVPALREAVKLFRWVGGDAAAQCRDHCVVNTDAKLNNVALGSGRKDVGLVEQMLTAYARRLGYADCTLDRAKGSVTLVAADGTKIDAGKIDPKAIQSDDVEALFRKLGRLVNQKRIGAPVGVPPTLPLDATTRGFSVENAVAACHLSMLAYESEPNIKAQLSAWGFDMSSFSFIEDKTTDTQAFVCADKQGLIHVCFRGSASGTDVMTDLSAKFVDAPWASRGGANGVKVHEGFAAGLDGVWSQVTDGLDKARKKAGHDATLFFTGHSLGGALTQLCAARCAATGLVKSDGALVYTKGGPRVGNEAFKALAEKSTARTFRLVHSDPGAWGFDNDPVTGVPPRFLGYRHAGNMVKVSKDKAEVILAGTPGAKNALESRMLGMMRGAGLESTATALDRQLQTDDASDPPDRSVETLRGGNLAAHLEALQGALGQVHAPPGAKHAAQAARGMAALESTNGAGLESSMLGVGLHFMAGYLEDVGKELLRKLR